MTEMPTDLHNAFVPPTLVAATAIGDKTKRSETNAGPFVT
jgi:hypothetical protein